MNGAGQKANGAGGRESGREIGDQRSKVEKAESFQRRKRSPHALSAVPVEVTGMPRQESG